MNKEFVYISKDKVAVTDENGKIKVRGAEWDMHDVLVSEDELEALDMCIKVSSDTKIIEKASIDIINKWYKIMAGVSAFIVVSAPIALGMINGLALIGAWALVATLACGYGFHVQRDSIKRINACNCEIKKAKSLKKEINDELKISKELGKSYEVPDYKIGEVVSVDSNEEIDKQDKSLSRAYKTGYKNTPKILVKTRSKTFK